MRGLEGRRVALFVGPDNDSAEQHSSPVIRALEEAGARIHVLKLGQGTDAMSELSFPASDPPAVTPSTVGRVSPDADARS